MKLGDYFKARSYGWVELTVVLYPILKQYIAPIMSLGDWLLFFAGLICFFRGGIQYKCKPLIFFVIYIILHEIAVAIGIGGAPIYMINSTIDKLLPLVLIMIIIPYANYEKVKNCFYVVGAVCMAGLLYHVVQIVVFGNSVSPITLPLLDMSAMHNEFYMEQIKIRPVSFFVEPASYAAFMLFPLALCLIENNIKYALVISFFTLLSTSSNGYFQTGALWIVYLLFNNTVKKSYKFATILVIAFALYYILSSELFSFGINKIQSIDIESDDRVSAGFYTYMNLPLFEKVFGVLAATPFDYISTHLEVINGINISMTDKAVFLPVVWFYGIKYGLIGIVFIFVNLFVGWKRVELKPLIIACAMSFFTQSITLVMPMFVILLFMYSHPIKKRTI